MPAGSAGTALSLLDELLSLWEDRLVLLPGLAVKTRREALAFFQLYEQALGEARYPETDQRFAYARSYKPEKKAVVGFVGAYLMLKRGERATAAKALRDLAQRYPSFPDPWIWLSATTHNRAERIDHLENAVVIEPAHPLAREALAIARGRVMPEAKGPLTTGQLRVVQAKCAMCGGGLEYMPGAIAVTCPYCGHALEFDLENVVDAEGTLVGDLQLRRRLQSQEWEEARRIAHCQACGAELVMSRHLAKECVFCGSSTVLVEDGGRSLEQPDGFLPAMLDESRAMAAVDSIHQSAIGRLRHWWSGEKQELLSLHAVYLPFWIFDGIVEVRQPPLDRSTGGISEGESAWVSAVAGRRSSSSGSGLSASLDHDQEQTVRPVRKDLIIFDNLVYPAIDFPPWWLLKQILPFELQAVVSYEPQLLGNWPAALYQRDVVQVVQEAYNTMLTKAVWRNRSLAIGQALSFSELRRTFQVTTVTYQLVLLPMWVGLARQVHEARLVLVNGQTGRVALSSPLRSGPLD